MKVISGGQTGIDRLALEVAKSLNIETGGTAPKDFLTEDGNDFSLIDFGVVEHKSSKYPIRTKCNIVDSDLTIYFASDLKSRGLKLTKKLCYENNKPFILNPSVADLIKILKSISIINIAGNRGSKMNKDFKNKITTILTESFITLK